MGRQAKISHYKSFQHIYGLYALLIALKHFERVEDFQECHYIIKGIQANEKDLKCTFEKSIENSDFKYTPYNIQQCARQNAIKLINY